MQPILLSEQDSDQRHAEMSMGSHVGNLFVGLLLGLFLIFLERRNQQLATQPPRAPRSWRRILFTCLWLAAALFVLVNLAVGP
ncbi:MAG: hypothetical protein DYG89_42895 [Caldilinea sp. CFX5]|nr:hypothetical protein [Caldilinea sp. CFX5]